MALRAIESGMATRKREKFVAEKSSDPSGRQVAPLTIGYPAIGSMIRIGGHGQIGLMAGFALGRSSTELPGGGSFVATLARSDGMDAHQREAGACMFGNQSRRLPADLGVAPLTLQPERRSMWVKMASGTSARNIGLHRSAVVMAAQTGCGDM